MTELARYIVVTSPSCTRCMVVKKALADKGIEYKELSVATPVGREIVKEYGIKVAGTIVDLDRKRVIELNEVE